MHTKLDEEELVMFRVSSWIRDQARTLRLSDESKEKGYYQKSQAIFLVVLIRIG